MEAPGFGDTPEKAQKQIGELKTFKALVEPLPGFHQRAQDLKELLKLAEVKKDAETAGQVGNEYEQSTEHPLSEVRQRGPRELGGQKAGDRLIRASGGNR
jgi:hypothetical protein